MNYLFFDIECCDGKHICEFGYVLTDESFNVISRNVITINPNMPFDLTARPNHKELELYYSDAKYYLSPTFPELYEEIKGIVTAPDQMIFGHAIENDAKFLSTACIRYDLPPIDFKFYDSQKLFDHVEETGSTTSLELAIEKYSLPKPEYFHRSDCDAYATMELIRILMGKLEISPTELEEKHFYCAGRIENHVIRLNEERYKWEKALADLAEGTISKNKAKALIPRLISRMERLEETENPEINEKTVCFDNSFEKNHTRETVAIMQLVINAGGKYITQADICD
ncbi:MAG: hypothetical protein IJY04_02985, partial [Clostridia bacterium]|nr:hypothetical protein [Clostridia bacterium]